MLRCICLQQPPPSMTMANQYSYNEYINVMDFLADPLDRLTCFIHTAKSEIDMQTGMKKFALGSGEEVACVLWDKQYYITGTDITKVISFRFQYVNRSIPNIKKFEEMVFSELRNLKIGTDSVIEQPKSKFLLHLQQLGRVRTLKRQKIFYWDRVQFEELFKQVITRDARRESYAHCVAKFIGTYGRTTGHPYPQIDKQRLSPVPVYATLMCRSHDVPPSKPTQQPHHGHQGNSQLDKGRAHLMWGAPQVSVASEAREDTSSTTSVQDILHESSGASTAGSETLNSSSQSVSSPENETISFSDISDGFLDDLEIMKIIISGDDFY